MKLLAQTNFAAAWSLMLLLLLQGCASMPFEESPEVTLANLEIAEMSLLETSLAVTVRVVNPNVEALPLEGAAVRVNLEGLDIGAGVSSETVRIEGLSSATLPLTVYVDNAKVMLRLRRIIQQKVFNYKLRVTLYAEGPWGTRKLKVEQEGRFDLRRPGGLEPVEEEAALPGSS